MFGGLNRLLATVAIVVAVLVVPPAAFASGCGGGPSAEQVYKECLPGGGNGKPTHKAKSSGPTSTTPVSPVTPVSIPPKTAKALKKAGKDQQSLKRLVTAYGLHRSLASSHAPQAAPPTAIGSAFDLGAGPTVLLVLLAGTALLVLGAGGYRSLRQRNR